jgi:hypothetical protein
MHGTTSRRLLFGFAAILVGAGMAIVVFILTWQVVPDALVGSDAVVTRSRAAGLITGGGIVLIGLLAATWAVLRTEKRELEIEPERSHALFGESLVGLAYVLLLDGVLNLIAFAGFAATGVLNVMFPIASGETAPATVPPLVVGVRLIMALGMAVLGALFFVTNSLRQKRDRHEEYDAWKFWSGLWFRLGEAVLFTVVFFLALRHQAPHRDDLLPFLALLLGMFVTTGETLVFGLAQRVLKGAAALVGADADGRARGSDRQRGGVDDHAGVSDPQERQRVSGGPQR